MKGLPKKNILSRNNRKGVQFFNSFIAPKSQKEDSRRKEFIFNVIIIGSIFFSFLANIALLRDALGQKDDYRGLPFSVTFSVLLVFISLYYLSRKGKFILSSFVLVAIYFLTATYVIYQWGADLPAGLLLFALIIIISGILVNTYFAFFITILSSAIILSIAQLQISSTFHVHQYWREETPLLSDISIYLIIFVIIAIISWLSNREIERSLKRARQSEADLKKERDLLEVKVEERTKELKKAQIEKVGQLYRFAEFGRLSTGLFHDLTNYLSALTLNLEKLGLPKDQKNKQITPYLKGVIRTRSRLENFIEAIRKQFQAQNANEKFSIAKEIKQVIQILNYKARKQKVELKFTNRQKINTFGNPIKFHHVITNIISNAIDSYEKISRKTRRQVLIKTKQQNDLIFIAVKDWGCGIPQQSLSKIFDPFFTTKNREKGTGVGLSASQEIIEKDFRGTIKVKSKIGKGTVFIIKFPIVKFPLKKKSHARSPNPPAAPLN